MVMEQPTLRQLAYAVAVADHQHFGRAAHALHLSQPGLSSQIQELERRLGVQLFERAHRQSHLTPAGAEIVQRSRQILRQVDELSITAALHQDTLRGQLRVAAIPTMAPYLLPPLAHTLRHQWPDVHLELLELETSPMVTAIGQGNVDLGLLAVPFHTGTLHTEPVADEPFLLALPTGHPLAGTAPLPLDVLADLPVLLLEEGHCLRDHVLHVCEIAGSVKHSEVRTASLATLTQMVASGTGVTLLPASAVPIETRPGNSVTVRPFAPPVPGRTIALAWRSTDPRNDLYSTLVTEFGTSLAL